MVGTRIGQYILERELGRGGFGVVYSARHHHDPRLVAAIKVLKSEFGEDAGFVAGLVEESRYLHDLRHPHIIGFRDLVIGPGHPPALVMELAEGGDLADRLAQGPLHLEVALTLAKGVLGALAAAHAVGVVHRDLKPGNVLLTKGGEVRVGDFGLAVAAGKGTSQASKNFAGTLSYASPESFDEAYGPPGDVYAVGLVMWEMLVGRPACDPNLSLRAAMRWHCEGVLPELPTTVPAEVRGLVGSMCAKVAGARPRAVDVVRVLAGLGGGHAGGGSARPASEVIGGEMSKRASQESARMNEGLPGHAGQRGQLLERTAPPIAERPPESVLLSDASKEYRTVAPKNLQIGVERAPANGLPAGGTRGAVVDSSAMNRAEVPFREREGAATATGAAGAIEGIRAEGGPPVQFVPLSGNNTRTPAQLEALDAAEALLRAQANARTPRHEHARFDARSQAVDLGGALSDVRPNFPTKDWQEWKMGGVPWASFHMRVVPTLGYLQVQSNRVGELSEQTPQIVEFGHPFSIGRFPVAQSLYARVMGNNPSRFQGRENDGDRPVEQVSWFDAVRFCNRLSKWFNLPPAYVVGVGPAPEVQCDFRTGGIRLPTETEWECAAQAGDAYEYSGGHTLEQVGWYVRNSGGETQPVGLMRANAWGIHDMSGNVWEWCWDEYGTSVLAATGDGRRANTVVERVRRGGSWGSDAAGALTLGRKSVGPTARASTLGFRLARTIS